MFDTFMKWVVGVLFIAGFISLFNGHAEHIQRVNSGLNKPVSWHSNPAYSLVCDKKVIGSGRVYYEEKVVRSKSADNSRGIWHVNGGVYVQKQGELCYKKPL
jgi:hypothetical protein